MSDGCVTSRFKILAYYRVRSAFEATQALPSSIIYGFKSRFNSIKDAYYGIELVRLVEISNIYKDGREIPS